MTGRAGGRVRSGFTLVDMLVSLAVVALLVSLLFPALGRAKEASRKVVCASNLRQIGLALVLYADDHRGVLPPSVFLEANMAPGDAFRRLSHETVRLRLLEPVAGEHVEAGWDGLGVLSASEYIRHPELFYCPSHGGPNRLSAYSDQWTRGAGDILGNYQYRGGLSGPLRTSGTNVHGLWQLPATYSLVSDGMRSQSELNHADGMNVLAAGTSVRWFSDPGGTLESLLPPDPEDDASAIVDLAWTRFDAATGAPPSMVAAP